MAYATRSRAKAAQSAEPSPDKQQRQGEPSPGNGDALSVEGSDEPELVYGLGEDDQMEMNEGEGDDDGMDEDDAESSSSSEASYDSRSEGELEDTAAEMRELERTVKLEGIFQLVDRLGEGALPSLGHCSSVLLRRRTGTFSSVYKAIDLHHSVYDNHQWHPVDVEQLPTPAPTSAAGDSFAGMSKKRKRGKKVYVALKRIYVTSSPQRIQNELDILARLRCVPLSPIARGPSTQA